MTTHNDDREPLLALRDHLLGSTPTDPVDLAAGNVTTTEGDNPQACPGQDSDAVDLIRALLGRDD